MNQLCPFLTGLLIASIPAGPAPAEDVSADLVRAALRKSAAYFRENVSIEGGYLWRYSEDLSKREGEGKTGPMTVWVQPPGSPTVGGAFLRAYAATGDPYFLDAARETAMALVRGQLLSGGWDYRIEFGPDERSEHAYRVDGNTAAKRNTTTLDDNTTQAALRYLMRVDRALDFKDAAIHGAVDYALEKLLEAQYPNGAWPQRFSSPPDPARHPVLRASYPDSWSREHPGADYQSHYTLNDNTLADMVLTMLDAHLIYGAAMYRDSAERAGGFLLLARMPSPQPAWAQQYDADMRPAWARKFEPPAVSGGESQGVLQTLLTLYEATGNKKYLEPIPVALDYFRRSRLADGSLARFYELETNRPLYFTKEYVLTYNDSDLPTHYGFKSRYWVDGIAERYEKLLKEDPSKLNYKPDPESRRPSREGEGGVSSILSSLDPQGRWVEEGRLRYHGEEDATRRILNSATFVSNLEALSEWLLRDRNTDTNRVNQD